MSGNETQDKNGRRHTSRPANTRPSLSPTKRKLPSAPAPNEAPAAASTMVAVNAAAEQGWDDPSPDEPLYIKEEPGLDDEPADDLTNDMPEDPENLAAAQKKKRIRVLISALIPVFAIILVVSLWQIFSIQTEYSEAVNEYDLLRQQAFGISPTTSRQAVSGEEAEEEAMVFDLKTVQSMNTDCVGWIEIPGTSLSYPLVRAGDNDKYLDHTFLGAQNSAGTIFMDYRNPANLQGQHLILYGHNMKNGSMFGLLPKYLDSNYLQANSTLLLMDGGQVYTYRIFSARTTDAYDPSYRLDFASQEDFSAFAETYGAPGGTTQMLTMSTCTNVNDNERILVHAYLVGVAPAQ